MSMALGGREVAGSAVIFRKWIAGECGASQDPRYHSHSIGAFSRVVCTKSTSHGEKNLDETGNDKPSSSLRANLVADATEACADQERDDGAERLLIRFLKVICPLI